jgi:hypothetical protein
VSRPVTLLERMAGTTRLELATSAVTGQRSNQLNYVPAEGIQQLTRSLGMRVSRCVSFLSGKINLAASFNQPRSLGKIAFVNDVVAHENAPGFVP